MKDQKKKRGKSAIIDDVVAQGISVRKATKALNVAIDAWKFGLWTGEPVEIPGGILQAMVTKGTEQATLQWFQNIQTKKPMYRTVHTPGRRRVVKLTPDPSMVVILDPPLPPPVPPPPPPPPPPPETAEEIEERQLATELLGLRRPADHATMTTLRQAVGAHPRIPGARLSYQPGALRRRLRQFRAKGMRFSFVSELAQQISEHYWL